MMKFKIAKHLEWSGELREVSLINPQGFTKRIYVQ